MIRVAVLACLVATPCVAQSAQPYKLIVAFDRGGATVVDYPNAERCRRAKLAIDIDIQERIQRSRELYGATTTGSPFHFEAVCIPG